MLMVSLNLFATMVKNTVVLTTLILMTASIMMTTDILESY